MAEDKKNWGVIIPGIIIALATLLTAIGGFISNMHNAGYMASNSLSNSENSVAYVENDKIADKSVLNFTGNVGKLDAVFKLTFDYNLNKIHGVYFYPKRQSTIYDITGTIMNNKIELIEHTDGKITAICKLTTTDKKCYEGKMHNTNAKVFIMAFCLTSN